jgi:hypothetical protein
MPEGDHIEFPELNTEELRDSMATITPHARRQLDQLDLDIESSEREIPQQDRRILVVLQKGEDTTNAENEAEILRIILEDMESMRRRILQGIGGVEPNECGAPGKTPVERGYQARRSQCSP